MKLFYNERSKDNSLIINNGNGKKNSIIFRMSSDLLFDKTNTIYLAHKIVQ